MTSARLRQTVSTAALLAAALAITPTQAQVQAQNGAALDANQQVGSGGFNQASQQIDYRARNLLVTGNVGGGRAFQGSLGYNADGAFQGSLGSDALFNFRRDSIFSSTNAGGFNYRAGQVGDRVIISRPSDNLAGFRVNTGNNLNTRTSYDPGSGVVTFRQNGGGLVAISGFQDINALRNAGSSIGLVNTPSGLVSVDASPLTGIRYNPLDAGASTLGDLQIDRPDPATLERQDDDDQTRPDTSTNTSDPLSLRQNLRFEGTTRGDLTQEQLAELNLREDPLAIALGTQVQSQMALQLAGRNDNNLPNSQAMTLRERVFGKPAAQDPAKPKAPENPYDKLIADILANAKGAEPEAQPGDEPQEDTRPEWRKILEEPEEAVLKAKMEAREVALRLSLNMVDEDGNIDYETELPSIDPGSELGKLLNDLSYDLPRVRTLAGADTNRINKLLSRGEQELAAERYIIAENIYRQVLREKQDDPLAMAGLVHSQMGAGMIRSAAFNIRGLFANNPELIALRYDDKLLPQTERLKWLQNRLQKMIGEDIHGADPGLVLAYLGYQLEAKPLIEFGLAVAESEAPRDPLMPLLRKIWIEGKDKDAEAEKPAQAPEPVK